jgi:hypothetical protein
MKMVYEYFKPEDIRSFDEWDTISAKVEGLWTWPMAALIWMSTDLEIVAIEVFDYERFAKQGDEYLREFLGTEVAKRWTEMSDTAQAQKFAQKFLHTIRIETRVPSVEDITTLLDQGYLVACAINSCILAGRKGYDGHLVVVKGYNDEHLIVHDPGLPARQDWGVTKTLFQKAWADPNEDVMNITAFRLKNGDPTVSRITFS